MMKYQKRPVVIEAFCLGIDSIPDWFMDAVSANKIILYGERDHLDCCDIETLEGTHRGNRGDWIIQGIKGEIYPCKPDIFDLTYIKVI